MTENVTDGFPEALQLQGQTFYMFKTINTNVIRLLISWIITNVLMHLNTVEVVLFSDLDSEHFVPY